MICTSQSISQELMLFLAQYENSDVLQRHQRSEHGKYYFAKIRELIEKIEVSYHLCSVQLKSL